MAEKRSPAKKATKATRAKSPTKARPSSAGSVTAKKTTKKAASSAKAPAATAKKATAKKATAKRATATKAAATAKKATAKKSSPPATKTTKKARASARSATPTKATAAAPKPVQQAAANGRSQQRLVRRYLEGLEAHRVRRGRRRSPESIQRRLAAIDEAMESADPLRRLSLAQERIDLGQALVNDDSDESLRTREAEFIMAAKPYSVSKGISYRAWRALGIEPRVLKAAGITRS